MNYRTVALGFFFTILIFLVFSRILIIPGGVYVAAIISTLYILLLKYLSEEDRVCHLPTIEVKKYVIWLIGVSALCILIVPKTEDTVFFLSWNQLPILNLCRLALGSLMVTFFPGFLILSLMDRRGYFKGLDKAIVSVFISLFIIPFLGLLAFVLGSNIQQSGTYSIISLNLLLMLAYAVTREKQEVPSKIVINLNEKLILLCLLLLMLFIYVFTRYSLNTTWDYGDLDQYFGRAVSYTKSDLPMSVIGPGSEYPFWLFIFLAQSLVISGVPYVNAFQFMLIVLSFLPILSFYIMVAKFFKESVRKMPIIATVFGLFGMGIGWIFVGNILDRTQTIDGLYYLFTMMTRADCGYLCPSIYPLYTLLPNDVVLAVVFGLLWLIYSKHVPDSGKLRYVLIAMIWALGYLAYYPLIIIFTLIFVSSIFLPALDVRTYRDYALSIMFGLCLVALVDVILGSPRYTFGDFLTQYGFPLFDVLLFLSFLAFTFSYLKPLFSSFCPSNYLEFPKVTKMGRRKLIMLRFLASFSLVYFYGLCFVIVREVLATYGTLPNNMHTVPWYAWPVRLGIYGLIALPAVIFLVNMSKNIKRYSFFVFLIPISLVIARIMHIYPFYFEDRMIYFMIIPFLILSSYALVNLSEKIRRSGWSGKSITICAILFLILFSGFLSPLLVNEAIGYGYWSGGQNLSTSELQALNFLRLNVPSNYSVLAMTDRSRYILSYAGLSDLQTRINNYIKITLGLSSAETAIIWLMKSHVKYIFLTSYDKTELNRSTGVSTFFKDHLLKYLPIAFQNDEVTIYEVPYFSIPTGSSTALVVPRTDTGITSGIDSERDFLSFSTVALSGTNYSTVLSVDPSKFSYATLILTRDINLLNATEQRDFQAYLNWINQGGRLIVLDSLGTYLPPEYRNLTLNDFVGWKDENFTRWTCQECFLSFDGNVMTIKTNNSDKNHDFISPNINVTVDGYPYVVIRWKTDGSPLCFYPRGTQSGYRYIKLGASTEWTTSVVNLKAFYDFVLKNNTDFKNNEQIDKLLFRSFTENAAYSIKYVKFYKAYPLPVNPGFADLMSIYYTGKTVEADGIVAQTEYFKFPSAIAVSAVHSNDTNTKILAFFTMNNERVSPYAFAKKVGKGEVIYLAASSYFSAIENSTAEVKRAFFKEMGSLLNILDSLNKNIVKWTNYFPQFDYIKEPVNLKGKIHVDTDHVEILKLNANDIAVLLTDESMKITNLNHSTIESIEYAYPIKFGIDAFGVNLSKTSFGRYLNIEIVGDFNLTMKIPKDSSLKMSVWDGTMLVNKVYQGETIQLSIRNNYRTIILVKNPTITIEGDAYFDRARIYRNYYKMPLFYDDGSAPFEVIGNTTFAIEYSDDGVSLVDNFTFNGEWFYPATEQKQSSFTEMDIPWPNVLTSPFHILLLITTSAALMVYVTLRRKKMKIRIKLMSP